MEPIEASLPAEKCTRTTCQEPRREGCFVDGEAELPAVRHDDPSVERQQREVEISKEGKAAQFNHRPIDLTTFSFLDSRCRS